MAKTSYLAEHGVKGIPFHSILYFFFLFFECEAVMGFDSGVGDYPPSLYSSVLWAA